MGIYEQPTCPHCDYTFSDEEIWHGGSGCDFPTSDTCSDTSFACPSCNKILEVTYDPIPHWEFAEVEVEYLEDE